MNVLPDKFVSVVRQTLVQDNPTLNITPSLSLADLELDSLSVMILISSIECEFGVTLPPDGLVRGFDTTMGDLLTFVSSAEPA